MSLRPVDMQVLLPKVAEVNRNQPIQNEQDKSTQQQYLAQMQKQTEKQRHQVQQTEKSKGHKIEQEAREGEAGAQKDNEDLRHHPEEDEKQEKIKEPHKGNLLDIKI